MHLSPPQPCPCSSLSGKASRLWFSLHLSSAQSHLFKRLPGPPPPLSPPLWPSPALISFVAISTFSHGVGARSAPDSLPACKLSCIPLPTTARGTSHFTDWTNPSSSLAGPASCSPWSPRLPPARTPHLRESSLALRSTLSCHKVNFSLITLLIISPVVLALNHHHCKTPFLTKSRINKSNRFCFHYRRLLDRNDTRSTVHRDHSAFVRVQGTGESPHSGLTYRNPAPPCAQKPITYSSLWLQACRPGGYLPYERNQEPRDQGTTEFSMARCWVGSPVLIRQYTTF